MESKSKVGASERCACDSVKCTGHACTHSPGHGPKCPCRDRAVCVVVLEWQCEVTQTPTMPRGRVRLAMCAPCAKWWIENEHDGVAATYQVQQKAEVPRG